MVARRKLWWGAAVAALILSVTSAVAEGGFRRYLRLADDVRGLEERNTRIVEENARLRREVDQLRSDPAAIERAAREELGFIRPGEIVFQLEAP